MFTDWWSQSLNKLNQKHASIEETHTVVRRNNPKRETSLQGRTVMADAQSNWYNYRPLICFPLSHTLACILSRIYQYLFSVFQLICIFLHIFHILFRFCMYKFLYICIYYINIKIFYLFI